MKWEYIFYHCCIVFVSQVYHWYIVADQSVSPNSIKTLEIFSAQWQFYNNTNH